MSNYSGSQYKKSTIESENSSLMHGGGSLGGGVPRAAGRGLSNSNKVSELRSGSAVLRNTSTGELLTIDRAVARISRMRRRVFSWANILKEFFEGGRYRAVMVTLTYERVDGWQPNHIRSFMLAMRKVLAEKLVGYAWVSELQGRGAVHYHVLLLVKKGTLVPKPDETGLWEHGLTRVETARSIFYICTYVGKEYQKIGDFPKGMRMFAVWIASGIVTDLQRWFHRLSSLPGWFRAQAEKMIENHGERWSRMPGGGIEFGGQIFRSPYVLVDLIKF